MTKSFDGLLTLGERWVLPQSRSQDSEPFIALLVDIRRELKAAGQFALADRIREQLSKPALKRKEVTNRAPTDGATSRGNLGMT